MNKTIIKIAVSISVLLNIFFMYTFLKGVVYQAGFNAGINQAQTEITGLIDSGKIIIPNQTGEVVEAQ